MHGLLTTIVIPGEACSGCAAQADDYSGSWSWSRSPRTTPLAGTSYMIPSQSSRTAAVGSPCTYQDAHQTNSLAENDDRSGVMYVAPAEGVAGRDFDHMGMHAHGHYYDLVIVHLQSTATALLAVSWCHHKYHLNAASANKVSVGSTRSIRRQMRGRCVADTTRHDTHSRAAAQGRSAALA